MKKLSQVTNELMTLTTHSHRLSGNSTAETSLADIRPFSLPVGIGLKQAASFSKIASYRKDSQFMKSLLIGTVAKIKDCTDAFKINEESKLTEKEIVYLSEVLCETYAHQLSPESLILFFETVKQRAITSGGVYIPYPKVYGRLDIDYILSQCLPIFISYQKSKEKENKQKYENWLRFTLPKIIDSKDEDRIMAAWSWAVRNSKKEAVQVMLGAKGYLSKNGVNTNFMN